jgi:aromatic-L-amino-acid decarboxylase
MDTQVQSEASCAIAKIQSEASCAVSSEDFLSAVYSHAEWIAHYLDHTRDYPVLPAVRPGDITRQLPLSAPEQGEPLERIFADFKDKIFPGLTLWNHPRFAGYFANSAPPPSILAEFLSAAMNANVMLWRTSPAATELEQVTLSWLRQWLGLGNEFFGIIYDTASIAVMQAIAAAREMIDPECRTRGMKPGLTIYVSEHTHNSSEKAALLLGFGRDNIRRIPVDSEFRMQPALLERAIEQDKAAGKTPCFIVVSVGSTSTSAIEPVEAVADIAERHGVWLHVDAAYAGSAALVPEYRHILKGAERAHSLVLNPHKWLYVGFDCSVFYTRFPDILRRSVSLSAEYLKTPEDDRVVNFNDYGIQLGRRFRALKLWYVMRAYGREGIVALLQKSLDQAQLMKKLIESDSDFEIAAPVPLSLVCFRHRGSNELNQRLLSEINASGKAFLSHTVLNGKYVLRCSYGNYLTTEDDVRETWRLIRDTALLCAANA